MKYQSTRNAALRIDAAQAITRGISSEGGLFVPVEIPQIEVADIECLAEKPYTQRAIEILSMFLTDFSDEKLVSCVKKAYTEEKFGSDNITGLAHLYDGIYLLELWHGPTCAFKDMALQLLPHLLTTSAQIVRNEKEIVILVATSGDTGKAALEGFCDVPGTKIIVFYPENGVSAMQKRQMTTQRGNNVYVCAIKGNFDDAQSSVKSIFTDAALQEAMERHGKLFSSANSINWGRLVPQIVYYISAYADLIQNEEIKPGDKVNICVPTGNFGNILAAYYAKQMGLPVGKLICASNRNKILTDFINTGVYDKNRDFYATISPSMDILISSNLERLLFDLCGRNDRQINEWYDALAQTGKFEVSAAVREKLQSDFYAGFCDDDQTKETIRDTFQKYSYLCDTHTAVAVRVLQEYREKTGDTRRTILASTANPYKFAPNVLSAVTVPESSDEYAQIDELFALSGMEVPKALASLKNAVQRFGRSIERDKIREEVIRVLGLSE